MASNRAGLNSLINYASTAKRSTKSAVDTAVHRFDSVVHVGDLLENALEDRAKFLEARVSTARRIRRKRSPMAINALLS